MSAPLPAPGWAAIDDAFGRVYPGQIPHQFTSSRPYELDGPSPLPAISAWAARSPASWHFVSYGLSELFEKSSTIPELSGFGIELTLRLPRPASAERPDAWGVRLLQALGHHCLAGRAGLDSGHCIDLGAPIDPAGRSELSGLVCVPDPMLGRIATPHGTVLFLQAIGLCADELAWMRELDLPAKVEALAELCPAGLTDPRRGSWLRDEQSARVLRRVRVGLRL